MANLHGLEHIAPIQEGHTVPVWSSVLPLVAGTYQKTVTLSSESCTFALWVENCTGSIQVTVDTITTNGKTVPLASFPLLTTGTSKLLLKRGADVLSRLLITVTIVGSATFDFWVKGTKLGEVSARDVASSTARAVKFIAISTPSLLVPSPPPLERTGLILKNLGPSATVYLGFTLAEASLASGYPLSVGESIAMSLSGGQGIFAVTGGGSADVRCMESGS